MKEYLVEVKEVVSGERENFVVRVDWMVGLEIELRQQARGGHPDLVFEHPYLSNQ